LSQLLFIWVPTGYLGAGLNGVLFESGRHPFDDFFNLDATSGLVPICNALQ
jgi:hypothetical protein